MKPKFKTTLLISGIALGCMAIGISAGAIANKEINQLRFADAESYTLTLDSSNAPTIGDSFVDSFVSYAQTSNGNNVYFKMVFAKSSAGNYVQLANRGYLFNHALEGGKVTGITGITATLASGSLTIKTTNADLSISNGAYLGDAASMTSGVKYTEETPFRYFQLQAGDSGATITSLKIEYTCDGLPSFVPSGKTYYIEDFESFTETGVGNDTSHGKYVTTGLRSAFYSTYYGGTSDPTTGNTTNWKLMGSTDYLTYSSNKGRNSSKCALFKTNGSNNFRYIQTKAIYGVNSVIGNGAKLSVWMHGAYSNTTATTASSNNVNVTVMAFYGSQFNLNSTNGATVKKFTVQANSDWKAYKMDLEDYRTYFAFGFYIEKANPSANVYLPIDDIAIYTTSPYPTVHPTGVSLNQTSASVNEGKSFKLTATVSPVDADNTEVTWSTNNSSIATVDTNGNVTGVSSGQAVITATTVDGGFTANCTVDVIQVLLSGTFYTQLSIAGYDMNVIISLGGNAQVAVRISNTDMEPTSYTYNKSTKAISIVTTGSYHTAMGDLTLGTITGTYDEANNRLTNVNCTGNASSYINNLTLGAMGSGSDSKFFNTSGTTDELRTIFKRRFNQDQGAGWQIDTTNTDRIVQNAEQYVTNESSMKVRGLEVGKSGICLYNDINNKTFKSIGFWAYNPSGADINLQIFVFKSAGLNDSVQSATLSAKAGQWTFLCTGIANGSQFVVGTHTLYNFYIMLNYKNVKMSYDDICLYI